MDNLKKALTNLYNNNRLTKKYSLGLSKTNQFKNNILIVGPQESGKTITAYIVGECYGKLGILSIGKPVAECTSRRMKTYQNNTRRIENEWFY